MQALATSIPAALAALAILLLVMVWAMVRFSAAMIEPPPPAAEQSLGASPSPRARRLGALYLLIWAALLALFFHLARLTGVGWDGRNLALLVGVVAAWFAFNALWIALVRKLTRPRPAAAEEVSVDLDAEGEAEDTPDPAPEEERAALPAPPTLAARSWSLVKSVAWLALVILVIAIGSALPPLQALEAYLQAHQGAWLAAAGGVALLGFTLLVGGAVSMALASGKPMSRDEAAELERRAMARDSATWRETAARVSAPGSGAQGELSFYEIKLGWRLRAWQVSGRWRRVSAMVLGGTLLTVGLFGVGIVLAPAGFKLLLAAMLAYAAGRTTVGLARA